MAEILLWNKDTKYVKDDKVIYEDFLFKRTAINRSPDKAKDCYIQIFNVEVNKEYNNGSLVIEGNSIVKLDFSGYNGIVRNKLNTEYWEETSSPPSAITDSADFIYKKGCIIAVYGKNYKCKKDIYKKDKLNSYPFMYEVDRDYWGIINTTDKYSLYNHKTQYKYNDLIYIPHNRYKRTNFKCTRNIYRKGTATKVIELKDVRDYNSDTSLSDIIKIKQGNSFSYYIRIKYTKPNLKHLSSEWKLFYTDIVSTDYNKNITMFNDDMNNIFVNYSNIKVIMLNSLSIKYYDNTEKDKIFIDVINNLCEDYVINSIITKNLSTINKFIADTLLINNKTIISLNIIKLTFNKPQLDKIFDILLLIQSILVKYNKTFCHKLLTNNLIIISSIINYYKKTDDKYDDCIKYFNSILSDAGILGWTEVKDDDDTTISEKNAGINSYIYSELLKNKEFNTNINTNNLRFMNFFELNEILIDYKCINIPHDIINVYKLLCNYNDINGINNIIISDPITPKEHVLNVEKFNELKLLINNSISKYNSLGILMIDVLNIINNCITLFGLLQQLYTELYSNYKIYIDKAISYIEYYCNIYNKDFLYNFNKYYILCTGVHAINILIPDHNELYTIKKINNLLYKIKKSFGCSHNRIIINSIIDLNRKYNKSKDIIYLQCMFNLLKIYNFDADSGDSAKIEPIKSFNTNIYLKNIVKHNTRMDDFIYTNFDYPDKVKIYLLTGGNNTKKLMSEQDLYSKLKELT